MNEPKVFGGAQGGGKTATGFEHMFRAQAGSRLRYMVESACRAHGWDGNDAVPIRIVHIAIGEVLKHLVDAMNAYQGIAIDALNSKIPKIEYKADDFFGDMFGLEKGGKR